MSEGECDINDILCQERVKLHLEGLQKLVGSDVFQKQFPEFIGLNTKIMERIAEQDGKLGEAYSRCTIEEPEIVRVIPRGVIELETEES